MKRLLIALFLLLPLSGIAQMAGSLDNSFSTNGFALYLPPSVTNTWGSHIVEQPDNKLVIGGSADEDYLFIRINPDSSYDSGFGTNGILTGSVPGYTYTSVTSMNLEPSGNFSASFSSLTPPTDAAFVYKRFTSSGGPDPGFGIGGTIVRTVGIDSQSVNAIYPVPGNKYVIVEAFVDINNAATFVRLSGLMANGTADNSYGTAGKTEIPNFMCSASAVLNNGKVLLFGWDGLFPTNFMLYCIKTDGTPDSSFGVNGIVLEPILPASNVNSIFTDGVNNIFTSVSFGGFPGTQRITKYDASGNKVISFGTSGNKDLTGSVSIMSLQVQNDGKIVVGGKNASGILLERWSSTGAADAGFGTGGQTTYTGGFPNESVNHVAISNSGKIYAVSSTPGPVMLARLHGDAATSVDEAQGSKAVKLYPNPANTQIFLDADIRVNDHLMVVDVMGKIMMDKTFTTAASGFTLPVSEFAAGTYWVRLNGAAGKFIVQH